MIEIIAWLDLETTGLDHRTDKIGEFGLRLTGGDLETLGNFTRTVRLTDEDVARMNDYVLDMHTTNGLIEECTTNPGVESISELEVELQEFMDEMNYTPAEIKNFRIAGSSVGFDRRFLRHQCEAIDEMFHYRSIDVSSFKETARMFNPYVYGSRPTLVSSHRVMADIEYSIAEYDYYIKNFLKVPDLED